MQSNISKIIWTIVVIVIIILILLWVFVWNSGNALNTPQTGEEAGTSTEITYLCPSGSNVVASFSANADTVTVENAESGPVTLKRTKSADGGRYANTDESFVLWEKGNTAMITRDGTTENCTNKAAQDEVSANKKAVKETVTSFGEVLQQVSLSSPDASSTIAEKYGPYVTDTLLSGWTEDPSTAPGREVSSPWPDHIEITNISTSGVVYSVDGKIILMTSDNTEHGGNAGTRDVEMTLVNQNGQWLINTFTEGKRVASEEKQAATGTQAQ